MFLLSLFSSLLTENVRNAEDRLVAAALIIDPVEDPDVLKYAQQAEQT